jgi:hypothetical protein
MATERSLLRNSDPALVVDRVRIFPQRLPRCFAGFRETNAETDVHEKLEADERLGIWAQLQLRSTGRE